MLAGERTGHLVIRSIRQGRPQRGGMWGGYNLELQKSLRIFYNHRERSLLGLWFKSLISALSHLTHYAKREP